MTVGVVVFSEEMAQQEMVAIYCNPHSTDTRDRIPYNFRNK